MLEKVFAIMGIVFIISGVIFAMGNSPIAGITFITIGIVMNIFSDESDIFHDEDN